MNAGMLALALALVNGVDLPTGTPRGVVEDAIASFNRYVEVISHNDTCERRREMRLVDALARRITETQARAAASFPGVDLEAGRGDTDYVCARRSGQPQHVSRREIRKELDRLLDQIDALLPSPRANAR